MVLLKLSLMFTITDNGKMVLDMEVANKSGLMAQFMREVGELIWPAGRVGLFIPTEMSTKENGKKTKPMGREFICTMMGLRTQGNGLRINNMAMESKNGLTQLSMKVTMRWG